MPIDYYIRFQEIIRQLNTSQAKAVNQIEGPVLVLAGPGTGKTHILAARIGRILLDTDAMPHNILCLTFTEAGVVAMRQRLLEFIGTDAHRVPIHTFHAFTNRIVQENMHLFGTADMLPVTDLERLELIHDILDKLDSNYPLKKGKVNYYYYSGHLQHLFSFMKMERWTPEFISQKADEFLEDLPNREENLYKVNSGDFKRGDLKPSILKTATDKMTILKAAADCFPLYVERLSAMERYDFDDMIGWTLDAFTKYPWLLRRYQEQYLYVLVDEYQDTNGAQNELILKLIEYWDVPNVFIVGDDDQSIYEFQGARLHHLQDFYSRYKQSMELVILGENYRSTQSILNLAEHLIGYNQKRAIDLIPGISKQLNASNPALIDRPDLITFREFPGPLQEQAAILQDIRQLIQKGERPEDIAIIYPYHKQAELLVELLKKKGIPYATKKNINILHLPLVRQVLQVLQWLDREFHQPYSGESLLVQILHHGYLGIPPADVARLSLSADGDPPASGETSNNWRDRIMGPYPESVSSEGQKALYKCGKVLNETLGAMSECSLPSLVERWINTSGLLNYLLGHQDSGWHIQCLHGFVGYVTDQVSREPAISLHHLLEQVNKMEQANLRLELERHEKNANGVQLITAHSSKGLEFKHVFLMDSTEDMWGVSKGNRGQFTFPDTLTHSIEDDALEARRRLFFVAMTRAKTNLAISWSTQKPDGKLQIRSQFIDEILEMGTHEPVQASVSPEDLLEVQAIRLAASSSPRGEFPHDDELREGLMDFRLSITSLNTFLECPLAFYYRHFLKLPTARTESSVYGIAVHKALDQFADQVKRGARNAQYPGKDDIVSLFVGEMTRKRGHFHPATYAHRLSSGKANLSRFYDEVLAGSMTEDFQTEYHISDAVYLGVPLKGVIDRIEFLPQLRMKLTDYKTGTLVKKKLARPSESLPEGGAYWRQMVFYKILVESQGLLGRIADHGEIQYVDPNKNGQIERRLIEFSVAETEVLGNIIASVWQKIQNLEFKEGCGKPECLWCGLIRNRHLPASLSDEEIEGLDDQA